MDFKEAKMIKESTDKAKALFDVLLADSEYALEVIPRRKDTVINTDLLSKAGFINPKHIHFISDH
ncbi:hypothetical protein [Paenibacillus senegalensis]|uniref:hypothetical protein n=1 Tax=Paenibacillus senegalensis TaxID=1465766 RepID=UPI000288301D|nr:hypothetical protein [Paenibacillus senegalensis]